jgi:hypothetical protein
MYHGCEWAELEVLAKPLIYGRRHHTKYARNTHIIDVLWVLTLCKWAKREVLAQSPIYGRLHHTKYQNMRKTLT